jgi:hypothetical protein
MATCVWRVTPRLVSLLTVPTIEDAESSAARGEPQLEQRLAVPSIPSATRSDAAELG